MHKTLSLVALSWLSTLALGAEPAEIEQLARDVKAEKPSTRLHAVRELSKLGPAGAAVVSSFSNVTAKVSIGKTLRVELICKPP